MSSNNIALDFDQAILTQALLYGLRHYQTLIAHRIEIAEVQLGTMSEVVVELAQLQPQPQLQPQRKTIGRPPGAKNKQSKRAAVKAVQDSRLQPEPKPASDLVVSETTMEDLIGAQV